MAQKRKSSDEVLDAGFVFFCSRMSTEHAARIMLDDLRHTSTDDYRRMIEKTALNTVAGKAHYKIFVTENSLILGKRGLPPLLVAANIMKYIFENNEDIQTVSRRARLA